MQNKIKNLVKEISKLRSRVEHLKIRSYSYSCGQTMLFTVNESGMFAFVSAVSVCVTELYRVASVSKEVEKLLDDLECQTTFCSIL